MDVVHVRKKLAGADSFGNEWPTDGSVTAVPYEQAVQLLAIRDAGFSIVDDYVPEATATPEPVSEVQPDPEQQVTEPDPTEPDPGQQTDEPGDTPAAAPAARRPRKTATEG